jgi:hypothetical protein
MAASKKGGGKSAASEPKQVRKSVTLDPDKLVKARELLGVSSDAEVLRRALDQLLQRSQASVEEEE